MTTILQLSWFSEVMRAIVANWLIPICVKYQDIGCIKYWNHIAVETHFLLSREITLETIVVTITSFEHVFHLKE